jgi:hypothetical protein
MRLVLGLVGLLSTASSTTHAADGVTLGIDIGIHRATDNFGINGSWGPGFGGRVGYQFDLGILRVLPEAQLSYEAPGEPETFQAVGGLRLSGFDALLAPVVFAHVGGAAGDLSGLVWDAGGGVEVGLGPVSAGLFLAYERILDADLGFAERPDESVPWASVRIGAMFTFVP